MEYLIWIASLFFEDVNSWYIFMLCLIVDAADQCGDKLDNKN